MTNRLATFFICLLAAMALSACQAISEKRKIDYKNTRTLPPLDIPPDLSSPPGAGESPVGPASPGAATYSGYLSEKNSQPKSTVGSEVVPSYDGIRLGRDGQIRWLVVKATPESLWPQVREFVLNNGLIIDKENSETGVIETDWAENRANVGTGAQKLLAKSLGSLYSTGLRDKYRIRLERGAAGTTEIYLSHRGMIETLAENSGPGDVNRTMWQPRPSDPELEVEMLRLLMARLGVKEEQTKSALASAATPVLERAQLSRAQEQVMLRLQDNFDAAWRRVGLSLDRTGFTVQDRDRSKGVYYVRYIDPDNGPKKKGFFGRMFSKSEKPATDEYQIHLKGGDTSTDVEVLSKDGAAEKSKTGERILTLLYEQLK